MTNPEVDVYLATMTHAHRDGILALRAAILDADDRIVERIKWNAPSFGIGGDDLITMRLAPRDAFQLVFHRGVAKQSGAVSVADPDGLLDWKADDRAVLDIRTTARVEELEPAIVDLVRGWIAAAG